MFKLRTTAAIWLALAIMAALGIGATLGMPVASTISAHSGHNILINARVAQDVANQGVSAKIRTDHPGAMTSHHFSYTRVAVVYDHTQDSNHTSGECMTHCYGEIGPFIAGPDYVEGTTNGNVIPLIVYRNQGGRWSYYANTTLADNSYHTWKVVNNKTCNDTPTTLDFAWDFCQGTSKIITLDLGFDRGTMFISGAEVKTHGVAMMESWHVSNRYIDDGTNNWTNTSNVWCADGTYDSSTKICTSSADDDYRVRYVTVGNDSSWKTDYNP